MRQVSELARVEKWADALIALHLDATWSFGFDSAKRRLGACDYTRRRITISRYLIPLLSDDEVHQTLLHEVAHAIAGPGSNHSREWLRIARELGYEGGASHPGPGAEDLAPWVGTCPSGHRVYRYKAPQRTLSCGRCTRGFDRSAVISWEHREISAAMRRAARAS